MLFLSDQMKGSVSIFQLSGPFLRRISIVFQPDLTISLHLDVPKARVALETILQKIVYSRE